MKIPSRETKQHSIPNNSDLFGTIYYTKNVNLDEEGYIKLSSRAVSLFAENDGTNANLRLPVAFGRKSIFDTSIDYAVTTAGQKGYWLTLANSGNTLNVDVGTGVATLDENSHATWFLNLWTITNNTDFYSKADLTDVATYTDRGNLTTGKAHPIETFKNRNTVCIGNGNVVSQFNSSYTSTTDLTLLSDFEVVGLKYVNNKMGVIAMLSDTAQGQNQQSFFFTWDGADTTAGQGFPVGSDKVIAIGEYKGSWIVLTRQGQVKFFTGGGWQKLFDLPFYYQKLVWGTPYTRDLLGDVFLTEGDLVYLNTNALFNAYGDNYEQVSENNIGGILCYDPAVGVYNRYTPSISPVSILTVTSANVNTTTNVLTKTAGTIPSTGSEIKYISDRTNQIGGLKCPKIYYCIKLTSTTFSLAETRALAEAGVAIDLTSVGATNNYFMALEVYDYGQSYANKSGAIAELGELTPTHDHLIFGAELNDYNAQGNSNHINITVPDFENRGYIVTPKITSSGITDLNKKLYLKFKPLKTGDSIIFKRKTKTILGLPITTPQARSTSINQCIWTGRKSFYTTANLEDAKTAFDNGHELECEIIAGAGAGVMEKIMDIEVSLGTYVISFENDVTGVNSGSYSDIKIDNWKKIFAIDDSYEKDYVELPIDEVSSWIQYKIELRGSEIKIEELTLVNSVQKQNE